MEEDTGVLPRKDDFSQWYNEILWRAEIMDVRYPVKGLYVWYPHGFAIRKRAYGILRDLMDRDHAETMFPLLIPETEFMKEATHIKGFEDEVYWVTHGGKNELDVPLALRPTSETAIYPMYSLWIRSHKDLPLKLYQIVNTFRYETKHTRPLIRLREITSFKEAHTVHATREEAAAQVEVALGLYREFYDRLRVPVIISRRPSWDKFPGADYTIAVDTIMPDGKTLQIGTAHMLGDHFSRTYDITYEDTNGERQYAYQTCYGISERSIAATISVHGDDKGLVLPPEVAPIEVVIVPIIVGKRRDEVLSAASALEVDLRKAGFVVKLDDRDMRPGAKYYHWEMRGVPLRIEIGPRDIDANTVVAVTRNGRKTTLDRRGVVEGVCSVLAEFGVELSKAAVEAVASRITVTGTLEEAAAAVKTGVAVVHWCGSQECAEKIEAAVDASILGSDIRSDLITVSDGPCIACGENGTSALVARTY
ncbi:MAG: Proline--tRNA ligase [Methanoculleus marisnigri]|jgi:prolyl-tRNA synthetase|uniref:Proline--tRNA ligase n=1 Tax=Methanoculleus marisnigri TaxID=2198 RepID=A0A117MGY5_9EURY|nr:proline--tRNA ligase [Methanoculleus marisnigri]KUK63475.1 MAG: Proline--tRNA ligase [Methanoculleus marisnigri]KUL03540.1 MAG: Proline--tRNA ligase [Methanoculleus marisnigri]